MFVVLFNGVTNSVVIFMGRAIFTVYGAFNAGSSKHGYIRRASFGRNCVATNLRGLPSFSTYDPRKRPDAPSHITPLNTMWTSQRAPFLSGSAKWISKMGFLTWRSTRRNLRSFPLSSLKVTIKERKFPHEPYLFADIWDTFTLDSWISRSACAWIHISLESSTKLTFILTMPENELSSKFGRISSV